MPRSRRKATKSTSITPLHKPAKNSTRLSVDGVPSVDYSSLKRVQLQQHCKKFGIRATGKNAELVERLKACHEEPLVETVNSKEEKTAKAKEHCEKHGNAELVERLKACHEEPLVETVNSKEEKTAKAKEHCEKHGASLISPPEDLTKKVKVEDCEDKTDMIRGWCVVHGMVLHRPSSSWAPLLLRRGSVWVQDGNNVVPFNLPPLNINVPEDLLDNYICEDCVLRNREMPKKCLLCKQIPGKINQTRLSQNFIKNMTPLENNPPEPSRLSISGSNDRRRTVEIRKLYQPQEDQAYAQRVDVILSQMARGELGMDRALRPIQPLVVHSPAPFER